MPFMILPKEEMPESEPFYKTDEVVQGVLGLGYTSQQPNGNTSIALLD